MALTVEVKQLSKHYGSKRALYNVSFRLEKGCALGLVGSNGAGKSTLLRILLGLTAPSQGSVAYEGRPLWPHPEKALQRVGGFVDSPHFHSALTAQENLLMMAELLGVRHGRVKEVLDYVHLTDVGHEKVAGFSHGMRQRLGIASALLKEPHLLIFDEPEDGLDPKRLAEMRQLLMDIRSTLHPTIIIASHAIEDLEQLCDQIAVFDQGQLVYWGSPASLGGGEDEVLWEVSPVFHAMEGLARMGLQARLLRDGRVGVLWDDTLDLGQVNARLISGGLTVKTVIRQVASLESRLLRYLEENHVDIR